MLNVEAVRNLVKQKVSQRGYTLEERKSATTSSWYFKISSGEYSLLFRVSDHKTGSKVVTLRVDKNTKFKVAEKFINNRCDDLGARIVKTALGMK
jgi:hypothetical protein